MMKSGMIWNHKWQNIWMNFLMQLDPMGWSQTDRRYLKRADLRNDARAGLQLPSEFLRCQWGNHRKRCLPKACPRWGPRTREILKYNQHCSCPTLQVREKFRLNKYVLSFLSLSSTHILTVLIWVMGNTSMFLTEGIPLSLKWCTSPKYPANKWS